METGTMLLTTPALIARMWRLAAVLLLALSLPAMAQPAAGPQEGREYMRFKTPVPVETGKKIEVIEFFSYACPHCADFEPALDAWLKHKPKDVEFKAIPMVFKESWKSTAKLYYTLEAMGFVDKYQAKVYEAIHKQSKDLGTDQGVKQWAKDAGIDSAKFDQVYDSFGIDAKLQRSMAVARGYGVQFTPSMAIDGKYYTGPSMVSTGGSGPPDYDRFFKVVNELIDMERKARKK
jgi:protein dithiol oxidoreductase (disulfide-forming)